MQIKKFVSMYSRTGRDQQRYNFDGCRQVVGCIPYRFRKNHKASSVHGTLVNELEFLLISSQKSTKLMFPKGGWEGDETMEDAARRETMEEAGVLGVVGKELGVWSFKSKSRDAFHEGHMLAFEVKHELDCWPEKDVRSRVWLSADEARKLCAHEWMKEALDKFIVQLEEDEGKTLPPSSLDLTGDSDVICNILQLSADGARKLRAHEWMKEALDKFIVQLEEDDEGKTLPPSSLDLTGDSDVICNIFQLSANEARKLCAHEWMKEALDKFIVQHKGETLPPSLDLTGFDESNCGGLSFSEEEEEDEVSRTFPHFQMKEEEGSIHMFMHPLSRSPCSTENSTMSRVSQSGDEDVDRIPLLVN